MKKTNSYQSPNNIPQNFEKYVVLHGLTPNYRETEDELFDRVSYVFYDILNMNISQYIEEINFIGKKGYKSPLKIELTNKRLRKHILKNAPYFKENGLAVTEYLSESDLRERRELKKALLKARNNGQHAIIRQNRLIINGKVSNGCHSNRDSTTGNDGSFNGTQENITIKPIPSTRTQDQNTIRQDLKHHQQQTNHKKNHSFRN